ncbi:ABC transporter permease [Marinicrinis lubricantis]|uniref:ABC transporter permease n=1 Tax=Marinicrinis lubricantis TaxID=2086470 RepID=A0ABW1IUT6_9BACL
MSGHARIPQWIKKGWPAAATVILLLILWEWGALLGRIEPYILPRPSSIWEEFISQPGRILQHTWVTVRITIAGFAVGALLGIMASIPLHLVSWIHSALYPLVIISQNIPIIIMAPLLFIWFGYTLVPHFIIISLVCFFPITMACLSGYQQTDGTMINYMKMSGASRLQIFTKLEWPYSLPFLFSGLKISAAYSVMGVVIAEWSAGSQEGIASYMKIAQSSFRVDRVFIGCFMIIIFSLVMVGLVSWAEKKLLRWKPDTRK